MRSKSLCSRGGDCFNTVLTKLLFLSPTIEEMTEDDAFVSNKLHSNAGETLAGVPQLTV